ncbi:MAG: hypothetical protein LQ351_000322 [Letrouitia transgressa]|nr:MAG: hypothetical protein LQ351_000322 [Letrouitia transgressa]
MQAYRVTRLPRACKPLVALASPTAQSARAMSTLFPQFPAQALSPFLRDFDALFPSEGFFARPPQSRPFTPRFDVREVGSAYELQGELPGIKQEDIEIQFIDANTLVIKGKTEREHVQQSNQSADAGEGVSGKDAIADNTSESSSTYHKASVEDEYVDAGAEGVEAKPENEVAAAPSQPATVSEPESRFWISERSVGEFQRTFSFPGKVDQEAVKASLKNGILNVVVPKAARKEKRIVIE